MVVVNLLSHVIDEKMVSPKLKELLGKPKNSGRYFTATSEKLVHEMDEGA